MKIKTLKYNYQASSIIKHLQAEGFTVYRELARTHLIKHLVIWRVSIPKQKFPDLAWKANFHRIIRNEIRDFILDQEDLVPIEFSEPGWGIALILRLENQDQIFEVGQKI